MLSASANKLSRLKEQAEEYAALIMEELDPERLGYIEVRPCLASIPLLDSLLLIYPKKKKKKTLLLAWP